jgi:hypothetical protein
MKFRAQADWDHLKFLPIRPHENKVQPISSLYRHYKRREGSIKTTIVEADGKKRRAARQENRTKY